MSTDNVSVLNDYLEGAGLSKAAFAHRLGVSPEALHGLLSGAEPCGPVMARRIEDASDGVLHAEQLMDANIAAIRFRADVDEVSEELLLAAFRKSCVVDIGVLSPDHIAPAVIAVINTFDGIGAISGLVRQDRLLLALRAVLKEIAADCGTPSRDDPAIEAAADEIRRHYQPSE